MKKTNITQKKLTQIYQFESYLTSLCVRVAHTHTHIIINFYLIYNKILIKTDI